MKSKERWRRIDQECYEYTRMYNKKTDEENEEEFI